MARGTLFVVATPIGNLQDVSERARSTLAGVALIAAEDTRHTGALLAALGVETPSTALHDHNETARVPGLLARLEAGDDLALVSDAGTPLLSDPGFRLVRAAAEAGIAVRPIPGPSALTAALSVAGLPTDRFRFEGFLPAKAAARRQALEALSGERATLVLFEAPHRIAALLADMAAVLGARTAWVGRELTKTYESHRRGALDDLAEVFAAGEEPARGEFVVIVEGVPDGDDGAFADVDALLAELLRELPASRAARVAARLTSHARSALYQRALALGGRGD